MDYSVVRAMSDDKIEEQIFRVAQNTSPGLNFWLEEYQRRQDERQTKEAFELNKQSIQLAQLSLEEAKESRKIAEASLDVSKEARNIAIFGRKVSILSLWAAVVAVIPFIAVGLATIINWIIKMITGS